MGDVPVENTVHGSLQLYRLLKSYPTAKLRIIEGVYVSRLQHRLQDIEYRTYRPFWSRLLSTRLYRPTSFFAALSTGYYAKSIPKLLQGFQPEAVLTVAHGYAWMGAARYARANELPLHLIIHDDLLLSNLSPPLLTGFLEWQFRNCYQQAISRLCISPFMAQEYERRYGIVGDVIYPSRAVDALIFEEPAEIQDEPDQGFTIAFFGSLHAGYVVSLARLAMALRCIGGRLLIFGPPYHDQTAMAQLHESNIEHRGLVSSHELIRQCRTEVQVMFVPMSFNPEDRQNMEMSFPSKLADYTALGLPLLINGPEYCSAVQWARRAAGVAEVVSDQTVESLSTAILRLRDPKCRRKLANQAIRRGHEYFSHQSSVLTLYQHLLSTKVRFGNCE